MSQTTSYAGGILTANYDYSKLFLFGCKMRTATYTNSTGSTVNMAKGQIIGRINSSAKVKEQVSTAIDGSQVPRGILANNYTVANGATVTVTYCYQGEVDAAGIVFSSTDTMATPISLDDNAGTPNKTKIGVIEDLLVGIGIIPITVTENTGFDN